MRARAIVRAVWRQDAHLARRLRQTTSLGEKHLALCPDESVSLLAPEGFDSDCRLLHAAWRERQRAAAAARLREGARLRPGAEGPDKWQLLKLQWAAQRRAMLWAPFRRRLVIAGVCLEGNGHCASIERGPVRVFDALRSYWKPHFTDQPVDMDS
eukprot:4686749-Pyramimonas_sp.AAC.1